jgi:hypothetical protein
VDRRLGPRPRDRFSLRGNPGPSSVRKRTATLPVALVVLLGSVPGPRDRLVRHPNGWRRDGRRGGDSRRRPRPRRRYRRRRGDGRRRPEHRRDRPPGSVTGDLEAVGGSLLLEGTVNGSVGAFGGSVVVRDGARLGGDLDAAASVVELLGAVKGDARLGYQEVVLGPPSSSAGASSTTPRPSAATPLRPSAAPSAGTTTSRSRAPPTSRRRARDPGPGRHAVRPAGEPPARRGPPAAPGFSRHVADLGTSQALHSGGIGLPTAVTVPLALVALLFTVVGIPLSLVGFGVFSLALWLGFVYGAFARGRGSWSGPPDPAAGARGRRRPRRPAGCPAGRRRGSSPRPSRCSDSAHSYSRCATSAASRATARPAPQTEISEPRRPDPSLGGR